LSSAAKAISFAVAGIPNAGFARFPSGRHHLSQSANDELVSDIGWL
jgi:hypothetical protein